MSIAKLRSFGFVALMLSCLIFEVSPAKADPISYTYVGAVKGGTASVEADFSLSGDSITITLKNLTVNPMDAGQSLSGLSFTVASGQTSGTLTSSSATERTVGSDGTYSDGSTSGSTGWALTSLKLNDLGGTQFGPAHTLIGMPAADNIYDDANGSIKGNKAHNPFLGETATFLVTLSGPAPTSITSATFYFGTTNTSGEGGTIDPTGGGGGTLVPEPTSLVLAGIGCVVLLGFWSAARRKKVAA